MNKYKIGIIGIGMVGTPLKRWFEEGGHRRKESLFLYDKDPAKGFSDDINEADIIFICVPSPRLSDGSADISIVNNALEGIQNGRIVVIKSTVPPGTTEEFQKKYPQHKILFSPEFLTEKTSWSDFINPDRQLVGWTVESRDTAKDVLGLLPRAELMSPSSGLDVNATEAEIIKYAANVFLARKVTFANAIHGLAEYHQVNFDNIREAVGADSRIGHSHLDVHHGGYQGYGGYCFVKDTDALIAHLEKCGLSEAAALFHRDRKFNEAVLAIQGLTPEDVSVHDHEWVSAKLDKK